MSLVRLCVAALMSIAAVVVATPASAADREDLVIIGDSMAGGKLYSQSFAWPRVLASETNLNLVNKSYPGTGMLSATSTCDKTTYGQRLSFINESTSLVVIEDLVNNQYHCLNGEFVKASDSRVKSNMISFMRALDSRIDRYGVPADRVLFAMPRTDKSVATDWMRDYARPLVEQYGFTWVDPVYLSPEETTDGLHPNEAGHLFLSSTFLARLPGSQGEPPVMRLADGEIGEEIDYPTVTYGQTVQVKVDIDANVGSSRVVLQRIKDGSTLASGTFTESGAEPNSRSATVTVPANKMRPGENRFRAVFAGSGRVPGTTSDNTGLITVKKATPVTSTLISTKISTTAKPSVVVRAKNPAGAGQGFYPTGKIKVVAKTKGGKSRIVYGTFKSADRGQVRLYLPRLQRGTNYVWFHYSGDSRYNATRSRMVTTTVR